MPTFHTASQDLGLNTAPAAGDYRRVYGDFRSLEVALLDSNLPRAQQAWDRLLAHAPGLAQLLATGAQRGDSRRRKLVRQLADALVGGSVHRAHNALEQLHEVAEKRTDHPFAEASPQAAFWSSIRTEH